MFAKFLLGRLKVDDSARSLLQRTPLDLIARHAVCDFGDISERRTRQNLLALETGDAIQSEYLVDPTDPAKGRVRVTTLAGWGETRVALIKPQPRKKAGDLPI
jgi:hypothetical protein